MNLSNCSDALVSDYSSVAIDYLLLDKPLGFTWMIMTHTQSQEAGYLRIRWNICQENIFITWNSLNSLFWM